MGLYTVKNIKREKGGNKSLGREKWQESQPVHYGFGRGGYEQINVHMFMRVVRSNS